MIRILLLFLTIGVVASCSNEAKVTQEKIDEVMAIHDTVMAEMGQVNRLSRELKAQMPNVADATTIAAYEQSISELAKADEGMQDWMKAWKKPDLKSPEASDYLRSQKKAIIKVSDDIYHAMEEAKQLLNEQ